MTKKMSKASTKKDETNYVDGFVFVVPKNKVSAYKKLAKMAAEFWKKHGALSYKECVLEDPNPEFIKLTFPKLTKLKEGETVWFSYIEFKSKAHRNQVNAKVMKDPGMEPDDPDHMKNMPFDMKRMSYGGFKVEVSG